MQPELSVQPSAALPDGTLPLSALDIQILGTRQRAAWGNTIHFHGKAFLDIAIGVYNADPVTSCSARNAESTEGLC